MSKQTEKTVLEYLYDYQTRLQGVAHDLAIQLAAFALQTDDKIASAIVQEFTNNNKPRRWEMRHLKLAVSALEKIRQPTYDAAEDFLYETSASVIQKASTETAKEFNSMLAEQRRKAREKRFCKELTEKQQKAILDGQGIDGATIAEWFDKWKRADLERITSLVRRASVEEMSVADITRAVRGTKENNYSDGILAATKKGAVTIARTVINGVSNNARMETIKENSDVIDGVKFIATLDGKTCPYCAPYDGQVWRGEDIATARRPPIHPGCRCTLVPYVELTDEDGNVIELDSERPAANADFDQLAKDAYTEQAKEKGWERGWNDLSPETRLKYFYQAQKDYEKRTGNPAYRQVSSALTFADYFKAQPEAFKRAWLGAKRYELYSKGTIDEKVIFNPDLSYQVKVKDLSEGQKELLQLQDLAQYKKRKRKPYVPVEPKFRNYTAPQFETWLQSLDAMTEEQAIKLLQEIEEAEIAQKADWQANQPQDATNI